MKIKATVESAGPFCKSRNISGLIYDPVFVSWGHENQLTAKSNLFFKGKGDLLNRINKEVL